MGVPPVIIHFSRICPFHFGVPPFMENPHLWPNRRMFFSVDVCPERSRAQARPCGAKRSHPAHLSATGGAENLGYHLQLSITGPLRWFGIPLYNPIHTYAYYRNVYILCVCVIVCIYVQAHSYTYVNAYAHCFYPYMQQNYPGLPRPSATSNTMVQGEGNHHH